MCTRCDEKRFSDWVQDWVQVEALFLVLPARKSRQVNEFVEGYEPGGRISQIDSNNVRSRNRDHALSSSQFRGPQLVEHDRIQSKLISSVVNRSVVVGAIRSIHRGLSCASSRLTHVAPKSHN